MTGADVAALVVTYNRKALLGECLRAILAQDHSVKKLVVIDNASTDGTEALFAPGGEFDLPMIDYRCMQDNLGGAGGFKEGLSAARDSACDWVWLMDDDCIARPDTLSKLVEASRIPGGMVSFLASSVFGPEGEPMNVPAVDDSLSSNGYPDWYRDLGEGLLKIKRATFVSLLINMDAVKQIGLPIASYFIWGDDTEYTSRLTRFYGPAYMVGTSKILHKRKNAKSLDIQNESDPKRLRNFRFHTRNNLIYFKIYEGKSTLRAVFPVLKHAMYCLVKGDGGFKARSARFNALVSGVSDFVFHRYDLEDLGELLRNGSIQ